MIDDSREKFTHFGFQTIRTEEKPQLVDEVFNRVASKYDLMNDLMSFGLHRLWKRFAVQMTEARPGHHILDLAAGTGDLTKALAKKVGDTGTVTMVDINASMLVQGRDRLIDAGYFKNITYVQADVENLPFAEHHFDRIIMAFGLRNVTDKMKALAACYRVLKPGGMLLVLEFSHPNGKLLNQCYDFYSFNVIPKLGEWVARDRASYQYLVESIRMHPNQEQLKTMMEEAQFEDITYFNLTSGVAVLHQAHKY